jgi:hypothetical protein
VLAARAPAVVVDVPPDETDTDALALRRARRYAILAVATSSGGAIAVVVFALSLGQGSPPEMSIAADQLMLRSRGTRLTIPFGDIRAVRLLDTLPPLRKRTGWNSAVLLRGWFSSDGQSGYVHVSRRTPPFVRLDTVEGFVIVNYPDAAGTHAFYEDVRARLGG